MLSKAGRREQLPRGDFQVETRGGSETGEGITILVHSFTAPSARKADPTSPVPQEFLDLKTEAPKCTHLCSSAKSTKGHPKLRSPRPQPIAFVPCLCPWHKGSDNQVQPQLVGSEGFSDLMNLTTTEPPVKWSKGTNVLCWPTSPEGSGGLGSVQVPKEAATFFSVLSELAVEPLKCRNLSSNPS